MCARNAINTVQDLFCKPPPFVCSFFRYYWLNELIAITLP